MSKGKIELVVQDLVEPITNEFNFELVDVEFVKEGSSWFLRIYIDKVGGISIDDCQLVSEKLSDKLDEADPIKQQYYLEVSSPGLDRPIKTQKDFEKYSGSLVELKLYKPIDGVKKFEGYLVGLIDNNIIIKDEKEGKYEFPKESVVTVKRVIKF